jgi:hypothetical protein
MARRDTMTTTMATGDDDNDFDGDGATGNEADDDSNGATGDDNDDNDDNNDGDGQRATKSTPEVWSKVKMEKMDRSELRANLKAKKYVGKERVESTAFNSDEGNDGKEGKA